MIIKSETVAALNTRYLQDALQRAPGETDAAYVARILNLGIVTVDPDGRDAPVIVVTFDLNAVWAVRKDNAPNLLTLLKSLLPTAGSVASFTLNGLPLAGSIFDEADNIATEIRRIIETPDFVPKNLRLRVASEPVEVDEFYTLTITLTGATRTSDDGSNEHACMPIMKFRYMGHRQNDSHFNAGLNRLVVFEDDYDFPCTNVKPRMTSSVSLRAILQTDGDVVLISLGFISLATLSAVSIHSVEFEYRRCVPGEGSGVQPPKPPAHHHGPGSGGEVPPSNPPSGTPTPLPPKPPGDPDPVPPF
jgi:hypothetical protein